MPLKVRRTDLSWLRVTALILPRQLLREWPPPKLLMSMAKENHLSIQPLLTC